MGRVLVPRDQAEAQLHRRPPGPSHPMPAGPVPWAGLVSVVGRSVRGTNRFRADHPGAASGVQSNGRFF